VLVLSTYTRQSDLALDPTALQKEWQKMSVHVLLVFSFSTLAFTSFHENWFPVYIFNAVAYFGCRTFAEFYRCERSED